MNANEASSFSSYRTRFVHASASDITQRLGFQDSDSLLDVCCGSGELTKLVTVTAKIKSTTAIDINPNMIDIAKSTNNADNITYLVGDVGASETFKSEWRNSFDKVMAYFALNWIPNWFDTGFQYKHYPIRGNKDDFAAILRNAGFVDVKVEVDKTSFYTFENALQTKAFIKGFLTQLECIPEDLKVEFLEDVLLQAESNCEKTKDGRAKWMFQTVIAVVRKEST
ncbi:uncharacterized protein LOC102805045 [Saccoglossus kowalevskii]|uniref:Uncharacterized protein LOC102805045 n=1 Tax=Saccoglossus kowalevskii TaxID=10224 RepID=A0ABM0M594_SACKO|nr:PREDICTED: uncharacterized protein LOC102805045 [Saccoglossus kowalevskii]